MDAGSQISRGHFCIPAFFLLYARRTNSKKSVRPEGLEGVKWELEFGQIFIGKKGFGSLETHARDFALIYHLGLNSDFHVKINEPLSQKNKT